MQIMQSSLSREHELETKLALMQEALNAARSLANESMISIVKEDELISRMEMLESQLQVYSQNSVEDDLKKQLASTLEEKLKSESAAKESLRSILQEKLECVSKISQLQRDYDKAELECHQYKTLYEVMKQESTHELAKVKEQLKNAEKDKKSLDDKLSEERTALTATAETLKADVDFTKQQLNSVRARLEQTQDELFRYKVMVETEKQRKAMLGASSTAATADTPALNGHAEEGSGRDHKDTPGGGGEDERGEAVQEGTSQVTLAESLPAADVSKEPDITTGDSRQSERSLVQEQHPEESLLLGTLVTFGVPRDTPDILSKLATSEGLVKELRSTVQQYQHEVQSLNAQLKEYRSREHQLQLSMSVVGGQLNACFSQIQVQSEEIVRLRECVRPPVEDESGHQSSPRQAGNVEAAHLSELNALKSKFVEKEERERHLEDQLMSCKAELGRLQEECGRLQQRLMLVQDDCNRQLRVSQEERESLKQQVLKAQEESEQNQKKCFDLNHQLAVAKNFRPFVHPGQDDQHARLINTVALVAVGVALAAMVITVFS